MAKIIFNPASLEVQNKVSAPRPALEYKAGWYEEVPAFYSTENIYAKDYNDNLTIKHCVPFRDALYSGYIQESWQDIHFNFLQDGSFEYTFPTEPEIVGHRQHQSLPIGDEFYPVEFVFRLPWAAETPPGWSVLITQPLNRVDLPFFVPSAIVDSDKLNNTVGLANIPFYLKKDAKPLIKSGTPIYQIIPFKRESWVSEAAKYNEAEQQKLFIKIHQHFWGGYKKYFWQKKVYK